MKSISNIKPGRSRIYHLFRQPFNYLRTLIIILAKARYTKVKGFTRISFSVKMWSPNKKILFGNNVQIGGGSVINCDIEFGNNILVAQQVSFIGRRDHIYNIIGRTLWDSPHGVIETTKVEDDVWIGHGSIILSGVVIGKGSIVAAGSVVSKNVEPYSIVGGNPAKILKKRFTTEEIILHEKKIKLNGKG